VNLASTVSTIVVMVVVAVVLLLDSIQSLWLLYSLNRSVRELVARDVSGYATEPTIEACLCLALR